MKHHTEPAVSASGLYWVYFRGTRNGEHIRAENMISAKWILALKHGLSSLSYIAAKVVRKPDVLPVDSNHMEEL